MYNKISPDVMEEINGKQTEIPVLIWLKAADISAAEEIAFKATGFSRSEFYALDKSGMPELEMQKIADRFISAKRHAVAEIYRAYNNEIAKRLSANIRITHVDEYAPVIAAIASYKDITAIARNDDVENIYYYYTKVAPLLEISRVVVRAHTVQASSYGGYTGSGVKVGIFDGGIPDNSFLGLPASRFIIDPNCNSSVEEHATYVAGIMVNQGLNNTPKGISPGVTLYCTCGRTPLDTMQWFIQSGVRLVNMSIGLLDKNGNMILNTYDDSDLDMATGYEGFCRYIDYVSFSANITVVAAAGNSSSSGVTTPAIAYNVIAVGNINDKNTYKVSDDSLHYSSSYINTGIVNMSPKISKPDICAPGTYIDIGGVYTGGIGTSIAAPHVTGALALILQQKGILATVSGALKAIITAGVNKSSHHYVPSYRIYSSNFLTPAASYVQYGAGVLNCQNNRSIIVNETYEFGLLFANTPSMSQEIQCVEGQPMRVSFAFYNQPPTTTGPVVVEDMDIEVWAPNGQIVGSSATSNNIEIVDFTPTITGTYTVYIDRGSMLNENIYFGLAWG